MSRLKSLIVRTPLGRYARAVLRKRRERTETWRARHLHAAFPLPVSLESAIARILPGIPHHWCHPAKPRILASLIVSDQIKRTVEIGVYSGASFVPQALAASHVGGLAIGIDPYSAVEAEQRDNREILDPIRDQLRARDWEAIHAALLRLLHKHGLTVSSRILRMTSTQAAPLIESGVGLIHIDGNHDYEKVRSDIAHYVPKLAPAGYLVLDDIGWPTIAPQYDALKKQMSVVYEIPGAWGCLRRR